MVVALVWRNAECRATEYEAAVLQGHTHIHQSAFFSTSYQSAYTVAPGFGGANGLFNLLTAEARRGWWS